MTEMCSEFSGSMTLLRIHLMSIRILRFTRVTFRVSSSPFLLNATIKYHLEQYLDSYPNTIRCLLQSTYIDDVIAGAASEDEAFDLYTQAKEILQHGGFNLRKFQTNSRHLQLKLIKPRSLAINQRRL